MSGLPSSVEAQISATRASTSVVFASGPRYCTLTELSRSLVHESLVHACVAMLAALAGEIAGTGEDLATYMCY